MPTIVSSSVVWGETPTNVARHVREVHVDDSGTEHIIDYLASAGTDAINHMNNRVSQLNEQLDKELNDKSAQVDKELIEEAKVVYFEKMSDEELKTILKLPEEFEVIRG